MVHVFYEIRRRKLVSLSMENGCTKWRCLECRKSGQAVGDDSIEEARRQFDAHQCAPLTLPNDEPNKH